MSIKSYELDEPIAYVSGKVVFADQFKTDPYFRAIVPMLDRDRQKAQDLGVFLYFTHSPKSIYRNTPEKDRIKLLFKDRGRIVNQPWLLELIETDEMRNLVDRYCEVCKTPAQRLYAGMVDNVNRYISEISMVKGTDKDQDFSKLIRRGKDLFNDLKGIEDMIKEESKRKVKAGYVPRKFERKEPQSTH